MEGTATLSDVRICVVDDNRNFQNLMRALLRSLGFRRVDVFADPAAARSFVVETPVDMAFVDLRMPGENGIDWVRKARRLSLLANPTMSIALLSGHVDRRVLDAALVAGVDDVLVKPLSPATLHRHTARLLRHPVAYVRGADGYFGPEPRRLDGGSGTGLRGAVSGGAGSDGGRRGYGRSVPGLHVELKPRPRYDVDQTFLD